MPNIRPRRTRQAEVENRGEPITTNDGLSEKSALDAHDEFKERSSLLDIHYLFEEKVSLRGFVTIFWVFIAMEFVALAYKKGFTEDGFVVPSNVARMIFGDGLGFWFMEVLLIAASYGGLGLQKLALLGERRHWTVLTHGGIVYWLLRGVLELLIVAMPIVFSFKRGWHPIQRGSYLMHSLAMCMKVHSYLSVSRHYPPKATFGDYTTFLLMPTLLYSQNFPRSPRVRPLIVLEKSVGAVVSFCLLYMVVECHIFPALVPANGSLRMLDALIKIFPAIIAIFLLLFVLVFECLLNLFAELSRFADRHFYADWWNSTSYADFARKWNVPVHRFLRYHVYLESMHSLRVSKFTASALTFLISSILHELVMSVIMGSGPYWYLFIMQMSQIPVIWLGTRPAVQRHPALANFAFWISLSLGSPLVVILYCREHYKRWNQ